MLFAVLSVFNSCSDLNKLLYKNYVKGLNYQKLSSFWVQKTDRVTQTSALSFLIHYNDKGDEI